MKHNFQKLSRYLLALCTLLGGTQVTANDSTNAHELSFKPLWEVRTGAPVFGKPTLFGKFVYAGGEDGRLRKIDRNTGKAEWTHKANAAIGSSATVDDARVYFSARDGSVRSLRKSDGQEVWRFNTGGEKRWDLWDYQLSTPTVDHERIYFGSGDHHLYALYKRNGSLRWRVPTEGIIHTQPALDKELVIAGNFAGQLVAVDRASGALRWTFKSVGNSYFRNGAFAGTPIVHDNVVYVGSRDYNLYAVLTQTGTGAWNHRTPSWVVAQPLILDDRIYVGNSDSPRMIALNLGSGREQWHTELNMNVFGPAVAVGNHYLAAGAFDGRIYILNRDGTGIAAYYDTPAAAANRQNFFDGDDMKDPGITSFEELEAHYQARVTQLGAIVGGLNSLDNVLYYADGTGRIAAVEIKGLPDK
jgi:outer membrane protein assembly factor BamB